MRLKKLLKGLRIFLLTFLILQAFPVVSEAQQINLNQKDVSIKEVLKAVTQQTGYKFVYSDALKELDQKVSVNATNETLEGFLSKMLANQKIVYKVEGKQVLLSSKEISNAPAAAQTIAIKGKIVDKETGEPIPLDEKIRYEAKGFKLDPNPEW